MHDITISLTNDEVELLEDVADHLGLPAADVARIAVGQYIRDYGSLSADASREIHGV